MDQALLEELIGLEVELHHGSVRQNVGRLEWLLHDEFQEIGRSGNRYTKADILERLPNEGAIGEIKSSQFALKMIATDVALLTYQSVRVGENGRVGRQTARSSTWKYEDGRWQMIFHQGTALCGIDSE